MQIVQFSIKSIADQERVLTWLAVFVFFCMIFFVIVLSGKRRWILPGNHENDKNHIQEDLH